MQVIKL